MRTLTRSTDPSLLPDGTRDDIRRRTKIVATLGPATDDAKVIEQLILADNVVIPAYMDVQYTVIKPYVQNLVVTPIGILRLEVATIDQ